MKSMKISELLITICVSYTIISIGAAILNMLSGHETNNLNAIAMFLFTSIAVIVLSLHRMFDSLSPLLMIVIQYVVALVLVMLVVFLIGLFSPVAEGGYMDIFVSFTVPYILGAGIYYVNVYYTARQQNHLLDEIKELQKIKSPN